jgi:mono/diheme cytochrome c family protein
MPRFQRVRRAVQVLALVTVPFLVRAAEKPAGLQLTVSAGGATDHSLWPGVQLYVPAGEPASPFVPPGAFTATWSGFVTSELRAEYILDAEAAGEVKVEVNGTPVFSGTGDGVQPVKGGPVKLNKGANALKVEFKSPAHGDAFVRLFWSNKETPRNPLPVSVLSHDSSPALQTAGLLHAGRELLAEARCVQCHTTATGGMAELAADAPVLTGIGSRRREAWLARWIENPAALRPGTPMPQVFHGPEAKAKAAAVAAYLASLKGAAPAAVPEADAAAGKALYEKLLCASCHNPPDGAASEPGKISQKLVKAKFAPGALAAFLLRPEAHFAWIRMPNFRLTTEEAAQLAAYLEGAADAPFEAPAAAEAAVIEQGRALVASSGCVNCHALEGVKSSLTAKPLAELGADRWTAGCVADAPADGSKAPRYTLTEGQRAGLRAFAATDRSALGRQTSADFLNRQSVHLNCAECHGKHEGFPAWELLGGKLKPEWAARFIGGTETWKPRTWLEARMPAFPAYAAHLGQGLATRHGLPPKTAPDPAGAAEDAEKGRKLTSASGGFSCVSCHGVADYAATAVFEAPGINLAHSFERLQPDYFRRWLRSPLSIDPTTKMPVYFDEEGKSPLPEYYDGDGPKTLGAVWEYLRLASKMPKPE